MMTILLVHREGHDDTILLVYTVVTKGNQMLKGSAESEAERADAPPVGMPVLSRLSVAAAAATDDGVSTEHNSFIVVSASLSLPHPLRGRACTCR